MNAGFSSLKELKAALLAEVLRDGVEYDDALTTIGLGVVVQFEKFCNRAFIRTVADTAKFSAARETIAIQSDYATGWVAESLGLIANVNLMSGVVRFGGVLGTDLDQVRLTYTGGYFWNTNEDSTDALPTGATALPADLKLAWIEQCKKIWEVYDPLGTGLGKTATESLLTNLELLPTVKQTLTPHVRYQLT
jgi:hypothetical protein